MLNVAFKLIHCLFLNSIFDRYPRSREDRVHILGAAAELVNERLPLHKKCKNSRCNLAFSKEAFYYTSFLQNWQSCSCFNNNLKSETALYLHFSSEKDTSCPFCSIPRNDIVNGIPTASKPIDQLSKRLGYMQFISQDSLDPNWGF